MKQPPIAGRVRLSQNQVYSSEGLSSNEILWSGINERARLRERACYDLEYCCYLLNGTGHGIPHLVPLRSELDFSAAEIAQQLACRLADWINEPVLAELQFFVTF